MKVGDLIKHIGSERVALIVGMYHLRVKGNNKKYARLLFSREEYVTEAPYDILQDRWEVISAR